jgi:hypothetical protein
MLRLASVIVMGVSIAGLPRVVFGSPEPHDDAGGLAASVDLALSSNHYFRGEYETADVVHFEPAVAVGHAFGRLLQLGVHGRVFVPLTQRAHIEESRDRIELSFDATLRPAGDLRLMAGSVAYVHPAASPLHHTEELYAGAGYDFGLGFAVDARVFGDVDAQRGVYATLAPGWSAALTRHTRLELAAVTGLTRYRGEPTRFVEAGARGGVHYHLPEVGVDLFVRALYNYNPDHATHQHGVTVGGGWAL